MKHTKAQKQDMVTALATKLQRSPTASRCRCGSHTCPGITRSGFFSTSGSTFASSTAR